jgi:hypothetical protein
MCVYLRGIVNPHTIFSDQKFRTTEEMATAITEEYMKLSCIRHIDFVDAIPRAPSPKPAAAGGSADLPPTTVWLDEEVAPESPRPVKSISSDMQV